MLIVNKKNILILILVFSTISQSANAYIGPALALGSVLVAIGIVVALLLAIVAILYYPVKKMIKNIKLKKLRKNK